MGLLTKEKIQKIRYPDRRPIPASEHLNDRKIHLTNCLF